jgi:threo-3-hydroxy-L-aspartate ammonia-lyase
VTEPQAATTATLPTKSDLVGVERIREAGRQLSGVVLRTPLVRFGGHDSGQLLKAESLQAIGAFKIRGAYVAIASLQESVRDRGVITYSSGNHAQGVARAARLLGVQAVVVMPSDAPRIKAGRVESDGAEIVWVGPSSEERQRVAEGLAAERELAIIPPFDDDRIIAGQGTVGLEIAEDVPDLSAVVVPIGGGGLASGVAVAVRALRPSARIVGVEPELAADARESLATGAIVTWPAEQVGRTIADGTRTTHLGVRTFAHLSQFVDTIVTVSEAEIAAAVRLIAEESRLVAEPSGALAAAAMRYRADQAGLTNVDGTIVGVVSGGNVDPEQYLDYLASPLPT